MQIRNQTPPEEILSLLKGVCRIRATSGLALRDCRSIADAFVNGQSRVDRMIADTDVRRGYPCYSGRSSHWRSPSGGLGDSHG